MRSAEVRAKGRGLRRNILIGCGALAALVVVVLLIAVVLAIVNGTSSKTASNSSSSSTSEQAQNTTPKKTVDVSSQEFAVGDTAQMSDRTFTVNEVQRNYVSPNQFTKPQSGMEFVRTNRTITNTSDRQISFNGIPPLSRTHLHYAAVVSGILPSSNSAGLL